MCVHAQVMLLMLAMMIRVMNRHSQGRGSYVMMSSWLRGRELEGRATSAPGDRQKGEGGGEVEKTKQGETWKWIERENESKEEGQTVRKSHFYFD